MKIIKFILSYSNKIYNKYNKQIIIIIITSHHNTSHNLIQMYTLVSTRFTDITWSANESYRKSHLQNGCIYGSPQRLTPKIEPNGLIHVIEMNNSQNKIMGIGIIRNTIQFDKYYQIYEIGNYNRYIFKGKYHLDRSILPIQLVEALEYILFKEKTHMKRGAGMTIVPEKLLRHQKIGELDIKQEIKNAFWSVYRETNNNEDDKEKETKEDKEN